MRFINSECKFYRHLLVIVYLLATSSVIAQESNSCERKPASFVPDDDMIIVPMVIERNVYDRFNERHERDFANAKKQLRTWIQQEEYARAYGLENRSVTLPTPEQRQRFFERRYMRFLSKDVERSTNRTLQETVEEITADDEIESIRAIEMHEKVLIKAESSQGRKTVKKTKNVKVGKQNFKFGFQPRLEIGMAKFTLRSSYFNARAWVGINGNQEVYVERKFRKTKTRAFVNYYVDQARILASVDQKLGSHWSLRLTHDRDLENPDSATNAAISEKSVLQLRFGMRF